MLVNEKLLKRDLHIVHVLVVISKKVVDRKIILHVDLVHNKHLNYYDKIVEHVTMLELVKQVIVTVFTKH